MSDSIYTYKEWKDCYQYVLQNIKGLKERKDIQGLERSVERLFEELEKTKVELAVMRNSVKWITLFGGSIGTVLGTIIIQIILHYLGIVNIK